MPNITAGQPVKASDFPATVSASDTDAQLNITNTSPEVGTTETGVVFVAPTTGKVMVTVGANLRNNSANNGRAGVGYEIYTNPPNRTGTQVVAQSAFRSVVTFGVGSENYGGMSRTILETGLTPGATYYAVIVHLVYDTTGSADIAGRDITVQPVT